MKYILRQRRHVYDGIKEVYLFLDKHVKSEKGHVLWYIHSTGEWETCQKKTATMKLAGRPIDDGQRNHPRMKDKR